MDLSSEFNRLLKEFAGNEPAELRNYVSRVRADAMYAAGTTVPLLTHTRFRSGPQGLVVPEFSSGSAPLDYVHVYIVLEDYLEFSDPSFGITVPIELLIKHFARQLPRSELLALLAMLDHLCFEPERLRELQEDYVKWWRPDIRALLEAALRDGPGEPTTGFVSRQAILAAMRIVLTLEEPDPDERPAVAEIIVAILLVHAVASTLGSAGPDSEEMLGIAPAPLSLEIIQNSLFYQVEDIWSLIDRQVRLWHEYGSKLLKTTPRLPPSELVQDATGIELEDILALGLGLYAHLQGWSPGQEIWMKDDFNSTMPRDHIEKVLTLISATPEKFQRHLQDTTTPWDFMVFQTLPVLRDDNRLLVLDEALLINRVLDGLYWMVHEHERDIGGDRGWQQWTYVFGEMVELMVEDRLRSMAPPILGSADKTYYGEEDFSSAFRGKSCDAAIHFGSHMCLVEIVSGQVTRGTRFQGLIASFKRDTEKLVMKKARQLHESAISVLQDEEALTGYPPTTGLRIMPVVVAGGGYPVNPITIEYIRGLLHEEGLFEDPRIGPLSIIDLGELEMLEGLSERGESLPDLLRQYHDSSLARMPLRNYLIHKYAGLAVIAFRPGRMTASVQKTMTEIMRRLRLRS